MYIGEPSEHLRLPENSFGELVHDPEREYRGRTIDLLFQSVAKYGKGHVIGIILSGALDDGSRGLASIQKAGGLTMVLTPKSAAVGDMAKNATRVAGPIDLIGTPAEIVRCVMAGNCRMGDADGCDRPRTGRAEGEYGRKTGRPRV